MMPGMDALGRWMAETGTSQEALAAKLQVSQGYVSRLVHGERLPGLKVALDLEKVTGGAVPAESWFKKSKPGLAS
jgi:transcriptional regulator with XRE-family HTH domain